MLDSEFSLCQHFMLPGEKNDIDKRKPGHAVMIMPRRIGCSVILAEEQLLHFYLYSLNNDTTLVVSFFLIILFARQQS